MTDARKPVFLVIGAGAGIGGNAAARFAAGGYHAVLARRSDEEGLQRLVGQIEEAGGSASGTLLNASEDGAIEELVERIEKDIGPIDTALYNLGAQIGTARFTTRRTAPLNWDGGWAVMASSALPMPCSPQWWSAPGKDATGRCW